MLQIEFETLYGKKVSEAEYEIINGLYMLDENTDKKQFVEQYKKMTKEELMTAFVILNQQSKKYTENKINKIIKEKEESDKEAVAAGIELGKERKLLGKARIELAELKQKLHDFAAITAVEIHTSDKTVTIATIAACIETLGLAGYCRTLLNAGCDATPEDITLFIERLTAIENK